MCLVLCTLRTSNSMLKAGVLALHPFRVLSWLALQVGEITKGELGANEL